jgi:hypothetical protein
MDYKRSARRDATCFIESRISYWEDNPIQEFSSLFKLVSFENLLCKTLYLEWLNNIRDTHPNLLKSKWTPGTNLRTHRIVTT